MKILFFTLHLRRTGSEVALCNLLCHSGLLKKHVVGVASRERGELFDSLPERISRWHSNEYYERKLSFKERTIDFIRRFLKKKNYKEFHEFVHESFRPDLWYINTLAHPHLLEYARLNNIPCIVHSHETSLTVYSLSKRDVDNLVCTPRLMLACSSVAAQMLYDLGRTKAVEVCYPAVDMKRLKMADGNTLPLRSQWGIREGAFVWLMAGYYCDNKNPLRFIEIASKLSVVRPDAHFVWVGGNNKSGAGIYLLNVVKNMDLQSYVTFTGNEGADYYDFLCASDAVILTSSRESLSLVTAEAIVAGKPVVAFDCGGVREIIEDGSTGLILQSWNTDDAVSRMVSIMEAPLQPDTVQKEAVESKFDLVKQVEKWDKLIQDHIGSK